MFLNNNDLVPDGLFPFIDVKFRYLNKKTHSAVPMIKSIVLTTIKNKHVDIILKTDTIIVEDDEKYETKESKEPRRPEDSNPNIPSLDYDKMKLWSSRKRRRKKVSVSKTTKTEVVHSCEIIEKFGTNYMVSEEIVECPGILIAGDLTDAGTQTDESYTEFKEMSCQTDDVSICDETKTIDSSSQCDPYYDEFIGEPREFLLLELKYLRNVVSMIERQRGIKKDIIIKKDGDQIVPVKFVPKGMNIEELSAELLRREREKNEKRSALKLLVGQAMRSVFENG